MNSNRRTTILSVIGIIAIIGVMVLFGRNMLGRIGLRVQEFGTYGITSTDTGRSEPRVRVSSVDLSDAAELTGFTGVYTAGGWTVSVVQGGGFSVNVTATERAREKLDVFVRGGVLHLELVSGIQSVAGQLRAEITMPTLESLEADGGATVVLNGFTGDDLELEIDGAAAVRGVDLEYNSLDVDVNGASTIDLTGCFFTNADVELDGASRLEIAMNGGELTGAIRGVGEVVYSGWVTEQSVNVDGLGRVRQLQ